MDRHIEGALLGELLDDGSALGRLCCNLSQYAQIIPDVCQTFDQNPSQPSGQFLLPQVPVLSRFAEPVRIQGHVAQNGAHMIYNELKII